MGGMRRSRTTNSLVLTADYTKTLYKDEWKGDVFLITGMGKRGNQSLMFSQNKTLAESYKSNISIYLFEVFEKNRYTYQGKVKLAGEPYQAEQRDVEGKIRKVWIFPLKIVD